MAKSYDDTPEFWTSFDSSVNRQKNNNLSDIQRYSISRSPQFQKKHPPKPNLLGEPESPTAYHNRLLNLINMIKPRNLNKEELRATNFKINPTKGFFPVAESVLAPNYLHTYNEEGERSSAPRSFVSLDIETDDRNRPLSISALKFLYDAKTGKFHSAGTYQRYYETHMTDVLRTYGTHGLTPDILKKLREQQGATYSKGYFTDPREEQALREFIGGSAIVGQNVVQFDLPILFHGNTPKNSVIDTVIAARNVWKNRPNGLEDIFKRVMGKTMDQAGLPHHDANADTLATMMVLEKMARWKGPTGDAIRYVMGHPGTQLGMVNDMLQGVSQVVTGTYQDIYRESDIGEHYMSAKKIRVRAKEQFGLSQSDMDNLTDPATLTDAELLQTAGAEVGAGSGFVPSETVSELKAMYGSFAFWKKASLVRELSKARSSDEIDMLIRGAGFSGGGPEVQRLKDMAQGLRTVRERDDRTAFEMQKERRIERLRSKGQIWSKEDEKILKSAESFEDLSDAIEDVTQKNKAYKSVLQSIADIKLYDPNQFLQSAKNQWGGIKGASHGVIPNFIRNPLSRIGDAVFNYQEQKLTGWNALNRTWNSGIGSAISGFGTAIGGVVGGVPGALIGGGIGSGITGLIKAGTQMFGNSAQANMEAFGLGIQNTLNTLGAMISWIATPFQLLHKAAKLLIGSFGGLTGAIGGFMKNGIGLMSDMGNPLTNLTGMNYAAYEGSTMMDVASLFSKGTMKNAYEDFAYQQQGLLLGKMNTDRLVAASLLGVYGDVYNRGANTEEQYNNMVNKLLAQGQSPWTTYLANQIGGNLPALLRSAQMLGVTDINQLTDPTKRGMYWRPVNDEEERKYRWTQYEYGAATTQFGHSRMRLANKIWEVVGKDFFNGLNAIVDNLSTGNWQAALDSAVEMWHKFKEKIQTAWTEIKKRFTGEEKGGDGWGKAFKIIGLQAMNIAIEVAKGIVTIWDSVMAKLAAKAQGLIAYLSTISIEPYKKKDGSFGINIKSIKDVEDVAGESYIYHTLGGYAGNYRYATPGMEGYAALADIVWKGKSEQFLKNATRDQLFNDALKYIEAGNDIDLSAYGYYVPGSTAYKDEYGYSSDGRSPQHVVNMKKLFTALARAESGMGLWSDVAAWQQFDVSDWKLSGYDEKTGIRSGLVNATGSMESELFPVLSAIQDSNNKTIIELRFTDSTGKVQKSMTVDSESFITRNLIQLSQLVPEGVNLAVKMLGGN